MSALDDESYVRTVAQVMHTAKDLMSAGGYDVNGIIVLVEADHRGVTIATDLDDDARLREVMSAAVADLATAERREGL